jgi:hypothetical protein
LFCSEEYYSGGYYASPEDAYTYTAHAQHVLSSSPTAHGLSSSAHAQHLLSSSPTAHAPHGLSSSAHAQHLLSSPYHNGEDMRASASQMYRNAGAHQKCGFSELVQKKNSSICGFQWCGSGSTGWIHMFSGLLNQDPDPLVRGMDLDPDPGMDPDPDPAPSIIKQK